MTTDAHSAASSHRGGRAMLPGPRWVYLGSALVAVALAVVIILAIKPGSGTSTAPLRNVSAQLKHNLAVETKLAAPPKAPAVATATASHPDLSAMEGDPVVARLANGSASIFAVGPAIPTWVSTQASEGKLGNGQSVPSTFTVSFSNGHGTVPLSASAFSILTYQGKMLHPTVTMVTGGPLPATLPAGKTVNLKLTTSLPEGDGAIRWSPDGKNILVSYFWTLEFD